MKRFDERYKTGQRSLSREEYDKLIPVITDLQDELMIKFGIDTMMRREDMCNVEISRIDLPNRVIIFHEAKKDMIRREDPTFETINGKKRKVLGKPIIENNKIVHDEKWRSICISKELAALIEKFFNTLDKSERKKRIYLFDYVGRTAYRHFHHWCEVAGIEKRPIHALRATGIKFAHNAGWSDQEIAEITGDLISTIQAHYMTPSSTEMKDAKDKKAFI